MTVIATDGRSMAGDGLIVIGTVRAGHMRKVLLAPDGRIFGTAGDCAAGEAFARWMQDPGEDSKPVLPEDFAALVLDRRGRIYHVTHRMEFVPLRAPAAIGSGAEVAIGAMLAGRSPREAVRLAARIDVYSGGPVTVIAR